MLTAILFLLLAIAYSFACLKIQNYFFHKKESVASTLGISPVVGAFNNIFKLTYTQTASLEQLLVCIIIISYKYFLFHTLMEPPAIAQPLLGAVETKF